MHWCFSGGKNVIHYKLENIFKKLRFNKFLFKLSFSSQFCEQVGWGINLSVTEIFNTSQFNTDYLAPWPGICIQWTSCATTKSGSQREVRTQVLECFLFFPLCSHLFPKELLLPLLLQVGTNFLYIISWVITPMTHFKTQWTGSTVSGYQV